MAETKMDGREIWMINDKYRYLSFSLSDSLCLRASFIIPWESLICLLSFKWRFRSVFSPVPCSRTHFSLCKWLFHNTQWKMTVVSQTADFWHYVEIRWQNTATALHYVFFLQRKKGKQQLSCHMSLALTLNWDGLKKKKWCYGHVKQFFKWGLLFKTCLCVNPVRFNSLH